MNGIARPALACVLTLWAGANVRSETLDRVLAVVSGRVITLSDVTAARDFGLVAGVGSADPIREVLLRLIDRQLVLAEVERYAPPDPGDDQVSREVQRVRAMFPSPGAYAAALARSGMDERHLRQTLRDDLRISAYLDLRFVVAPSSEDEVGQYYRDHILQFTRGGQRLPLESVSAEIEKTLAAERRAMLIDDWISGLRRRAVITNLYLSNP